MGEIHELFVLALVLVWFAGATPEIQRSKLSGSGTPIQGCNSKFPFSSTNSLSAANLHTAMLPHALPGSPYVGVRPEGNPKHLSRQNLSK